MTNRFPTLAAALCTALLAGCSTYVTVESDPEGALITDISGTRTYGEAPVEVPFADKALDAAGRRIPGFAARWPSGARTTTAETLAVPKGEGPVVFRLERPTDAPGAEEDLRHALKSARERARRAEEETERLRRELNERPLFWSPFRGPWPR